MTLSSSGSHGSTYDVVDLHTRAVEQFRELVHAVPDSAWADPTPCSDWDVRALVNHVVGEELWVGPLLDGRTIAEVGDRYEGDLLGTMPAQAADVAAKDAITAFQAPGAAERVVHLSFGETPAEEYAWQLVADHLIHGWDLAAATGGNTRLDEQLVDAVSTWYAGREDLYRGAGAVAARPAVEAGDAASRLLVSFGRQPSWTPVHDVVRRFGAAWEACDVEAIMAVMADDAVFESTDPAPDGRRIEGAPAIRAEWEELFRGTRDPAFTFEESFVSGDRATARWVFSWANDDGSRGHVRGADVLRVRDGLVSEKLSYVKG